MFLLLPLASGIVNHTNLYLGIIFNTRAGGDSDVLSVLYTKAYDAGCFGHSGAVFRNYLRQRNFTVLGYTPILRL